MEEADYVIVGAGPAGCALAAKLAALPQAPRIALIEAVAPDLRFFRSCPPASPFSSTGAMPAITPLKQHRRRN